MGTPHIEAKKGDIAETVLMPGDPLRARYIAEKYLKDYRLVNKVRNMLFYTGYYKKKKITVAASGMGNPSLGIYAYELIKFYNVKKIIRVGSCGSFNENIKLQDTLLSTGSYALTYFPKLLDNHNCTYMDSSKELNKKIKETAKKLKIDIKIGKTIASEVFDIYCDDKDAFRKNWKDQSCIGVEMESFALYYLAHKFNIEATSILTVVDSLFDKREMTPKEREKGLDDMIILALESVV